MNRTVVLILVLAFTALLLSCSYGIFNFAENTGDLELEFEFTGDNAPGIDHVIFECKPDEGTGTVIVSSEIQGISSERRSVKRMTVGAWSVTIRMMREDEEFQVYNLSLEVLKDKRTTLKVRANYNENLFTFEHYVYDDNTTADYGAPAFSVSEFKVNPDLHLFYRTSGLSTSVNVFLSGSNFMDNVRNIELLFPDGAVYSFGEENNYKSIFISEAVEDELITIQRQFNLNTESINGNYILRMGDVYGSELREKFSSDYGDLESKIPRIIGHNGTGEVPDFLEKSVENRFQWELTDNDSSGTILIFIVSLEDQSMYPITDTELVQTGTSGEFILPAALPVSDGEYQLIIASSENSFTEPATKADSVGVTPEDLRSDAFPDTLRALYGLETGLITLSSVNFIYMP